MTAILIFKCTEGAGVGDYSSSGGGEKNIFLASSQTALAPQVVLTIMQDVQPVTQSARPRRSYGKIEDCKQSSFSVMAAAAATGRVYIIYGG